MTDKARKASTLRLWQYLLRQAGQWKLAQALSKFYIEWVTRPAQSNQESAKRSAKK